MNISKSDCMIRIKVSSREQSRDNVQKSPREAFWNLLRTEKGYSEESIASLEAQVFRKFGDKLRSKMVENIQQSLHDVEEAAYGRNLSNMVDELRHSLHFRHFKEMEWPYFSFEPFGRLVEFRQQFLQDLPVVRDSTSIS